MFSYIPLDLIFKLTLFPVIYYKVFWILYLYSVGHRTFFECSHEVVTYVPILVVNFCIGQYPILEVHRFINLPFGEVDSIVGLNLYIVAEHYIWLVENISADFSLRLINTVELCVLQSLE